tara:strand:- start:760 stop:2415 length:1656 start_codon:yes stop_codon:yes gene_type:complete
MSGSYVIIQANQATISPTQNLLDFEVPDYINGIDMNESFINITYTIDTKEVDDTTGIGVHNFVTLFNGIGNVAAHEAGHCLFNSCLVRNVTLTAQRGGQLESIQRADLINQVKQQFTKNIGDIQGELHESIMNFPLEYNYGSNQARNIITEGTMGVLTSEVFAGRSNRQGVMRVNLKDVLGLGSATLNLAQLGALRLHMEANLNKFTLKEVPCFDSATPPALKGGIASYWKPNPPDLSIGDPNPSQLLFAASDLDFLSKKNCPFHVGMKVNFALTQVGDHNTAQEVLIKSMTWSPTVGDPAGDPIVAGGATVNVVFTSPILDGVVLTTDITAIRMYPVYAKLDGGDEPKLNYVKAELVVKTVTNPPQARGLRYRTFETQQDYANGSTTFNRTYEIPANAIASMVCFDTAQSNDQFSNSFEAHLNQYQLFVDNVGQTDRPVTIRTATPYSKSPLHGIMFEKTLEVMGLAYKNNLDVLPRQIIAGTTADPTLAEVISEFQVFEPVATARTTVLPVIYEGNGQRKLLNIDLNKSVNGENLNLAIFQMVERTVEY